MLIPSRVDDYGYVWFFIKKPNQHIQEFESGFPARMDFFKKGVEYFLQVSGKGWVVSDPEEVSSFFEQYNDLNANLLKDSVLVKVKMLRAEYYETQTRMKGSWWQNAIDTVTTWFGTNHAGSNTYFPAS